MTKYVYPAIFTKEENGQYSVLFPDIQSCYTQGENITDALEMAEDVLCLRLYDMEEKKEIIPLPSDVKAIVTDNDSIVSLVHCDTVEYRKFFDGKAIKKTLTIPNWLNTMAERAGVNFSAILQEALKQQLHLE